MGIKHFFGWFKKNNPKTFTQLGKDAHPDVSIDTFAIDLNAIFHPAAQRIYRYGEKHSLLLRPSPVVSKKLDLAVFKEVCGMIDQMTKAINPSNYLILCVDGVAGMSKMSQQRGRRFRSVKDVKSNQHFNANCISPGTEFMDHLTKYIEVHICKRITSGDWKFKVLYSTDKTPGEGEHKIIHLARKYAPNDNFCIYSPDADLIMLGLASGLSNFYIYRNDMRDSKIRFFISISEFEREIAKHFRGADSKTAVVDFVFICCMLGNDFIPQIPGLEIYQDAIDMLIETYQTTGALINPNTMELNKQNIAVFLEKLIPFTEGVMKKKYKSRKRYFPDPLMEKHFFNMKGQIMCDFEAYSKGYYAKAGVSNVKQLCSDYIKGLQWVMLYYFNGIPDWYWTFSSPYAPLIHDLAMHTLESEYTFNRLSLPYDPFFQLICVLPPQSRSLLPECFHSIYDDFPQHFPSSVVVDTAGKYAEWEGIPILNPIPVFDIHSVYQQIKTQTQFKTSEWDRNIQDSARVYSKDSDKTVTVSNLFGSKCYVGISKVNLN